VSLTAIQPGEETVAAARPRRWLLIDPLLLLGAAGMAACSLITLNSAVGRHTATRQGIYDGIGLLLALILSRFDYSRLREFKYG
jgi:rod shape determining protein RodA